MTLEELSIVNNLFFIVILIAVLSLFSLIHVWIRNKLKVDYWIFTTILFAVICFTVITIWHYTIGFIT